MVAMDQESIAPSTPESRVLIIMTGYVECFLSPLEDMRWTVRSRYVVRPVFPKWIGLLLRAC